MSLRRLFAVLFALPLTLPAQQQPAVVTFHFEHAGLPVPEYTLAVREDATGSYTATYAAPPPDTSSKYGYSYVAAQAAAAPAATTRAITLSAATTARIFERVRSTGHFRGGCESRQKNIANTGAKTINYTGSDGSASCTYNYSENKAVVALTDTFQEIAETLDDGRSIDLKHRYDRLGLDRELANLADAVKAGRAIELVTIAPVLQSLCDDSQVMERVRKRAAGLLLASGATR